MHSNISSSKKISNNTVAFIQLASYIVATSTGTHILMGARLFKMFEINLEKNKFICYKQKIATMFEVHHKVKFFRFYWSHQHTESACECASNEA